MVVKGTSPSETERWYEALLTHIGQENHCRYQMNVSLPKEPHLLKQILILDLGSSSVRAGVLSTQSN